MTDVIEQPGQQQSGLTNAQRISLKLDAMTGESTDPGNVEQETEELGGAQDLDESTGENEEIETSEQAIGPETDAGTVLDAGKLAEYQVTMPDGSTQTVEDLQRGNMRNAHFTQNQQQIAEQRRMVATEITGLQQARQAVIGSLTSELDQFKNVDWQNLALTSPEQYRQYHPQFQALNSHVAKVEEQFTQGMEQLQQAQQAENQQAWKATDTDLSFTVPGWNQEKKMALAKQAVRRGFTPTELNMLADSRFWKLLADAEVVSLGAVMRASSGASASASGKKSRKIGSGQSSKEAQLKAAAKKGDRTAIKQINRQRIDQKLAKS